MRAPRGSSIVCANWLIEAAYRMLQNNLDPEVAENPDALVVYGGIGKAARNWACFEAILESLKKLAPDETLMRPLSERTRSVLAKATTPQDRHALLLSCPEFMLR